MTWLFVDDDHDDEDDAYMTEERKMLGIRSSDPAPDPISSDVSLYSVLPIAALHILNRIEIGKGEGRLRAEAKAMGEEKEKKGDVEKKGGGEKKEEEEAVEVKLDMHCEGCALKVRKAVKGFEGVKAVVVDAANNKLKAIGKVDPWKLKEFLEAKTHKMVDIISPKDPPKKSKDDDKKKDEGQKKSSDDKKPKPSAVSTAVLKIRLHCDGCIRRIKRNIYKIKGVEEVTVDAAKDLVTVKGTMDVKSLVTVLKERLKRGVEILPSKKDDGGGGEVKKEKAAGGGGEKKEKAGDGGEEKKEKGGDSKGEKKEKGGDGSGDKEEKKEVGKKETTTTVVEANKMDYSGPPFGGYGGYGYRVEMIHPPQFFSDENPNACSIM
ncbi:heavy metal-associated isoprenylated plant protein 3-like [Musa acuminata AAA Group]|uniref:heavy metal-associated isoprenylated plant protein 3-like n=1 Tax=Musa acuminata AAA Group TaxID=214697 RepID=UPI0031D9F9F5